jgi:hypothetical protein
VYTKGKKKEFLLGQPVLWVQTLHDSLAERGDILHQGPNFWWVSAEKESRGFSSIGLGSL